MVHASSQSPSSSHEKDGFARSNTIDERVESVKPGAICKEMSVLKHCLKLAVEWCFWQK